MLAASLRAELGLTPLEVIHRMRRFVFVPFV